jgi:spore germination cell wall hydrolase CwlJ-like protein
VRTNKDVLDEAARSIRRTFLGSVAGTLSMLAVVGAAGAYGMPERLTANSLKVALSTWNTRVAPAFERAVPLVERAATMTAEIVWREPAAMPAVPNPPAQGKVALLPPQPLVAQPLAPHEETESPSRPVADESTSSIVADQPPPLPPAAPAAPAAPAFTLASLSSAPVDSPESWPTAEDVPAAPPLAKVEPPEPVNVAKPDVAKPDVAKPDVAKPDVAKPDVAEPDIAKPAAAKPDVAKPDVAKADAAQPEEIRNSLGAPKAVQVELPRAKAPLTPAQRLKLHDKHYDKAEHCLAQAVYFEARNQSLRGQMAVAQVVLNRVFSPYYPNDVCGVVFQNAHRHLSCQFTFACDGHPESVRERGAWMRAQRIAQQTLNAEVWLPEVAKATHYHAAYVNPYWVREMRVMVRYGLHTFYRPRQWGDGSNEPAWGEGAAKKGRSS